MLPAWSRSAIIDPPEAWDCMGGASCMVAVCIIDPPEAWDCIVDAPCMGLAWIVGWGF